MKKELFLESDSRQAVAAFDAVHLFAHAVVGAEQVSAEGGPGGFDGTIEQLLGDFGVSEGGGHGGVVDDEGEILDTGSPIAIDLRTN